MSFISALGMIMDPNGKSLRWSVWGPSFLSGRLCLEIILWVEAVVEYGWSLLEVCFFLRLFGHSVVENAQAS